MAANPNVGADAQAGAEGQPDQAVSQQAQPSIEGDVTKLLAGLGEKFDGLQKELRGLQGRQDKAENNFQAQLARYQQYTSQGLKHDEALREMDDDDRTEQRWAKFDSFEKKLDDLAARIAGGGSQANEQQSVAKVFEATGLDLKDPRVAVALTKRYENADQVELAAYRLSRELAQSPNPTLAQSASLQGGQPGGQTNLDELSQEYDQLSVNPAQNFERMTQIREEFDKAIK